MGSTEPGRSINSAMSLPQWMKTKIGDRWGHVTYVGILAGITEYQQYLAVKSAVFWGIMRRRVVIVYRRFGTTYRSHPHGWRVRVGKRNTPEDCRFHQHYGGSLKSRLISSHFWCFICVVRLSVSFLRCPVRTLWLVIPPTSVRFCESCPS